VRHPSTLTKNPPKNLPEEDQNLSHSTIDNHTNLEPLPTGFDTVVSALGRAAIAEQILLLRVAEATANIKRFFPSEYGTDIEYFPESKDERPHQLKLKVRAYIREHIKRLEYTYLVTGPYADLFIASSRWAEEGGSYVVPEKRAVLPGDGEGRVSLTTMAE